MTQGAAGAGVHGRAWRISVRKGSAVMAERTIYRYVPHRRTRARLAGEAPRPVKVVDQLPAGSKPARFNAWLAVKVTTGGRHHVVRLRLHRARPGQPAIRDRVAQ